MLQHLFDLSRGSGAPMATVFVYDVNGDGVTGITNATANLKLAVRRELASASTVYTGANILSITTLGTYSAPGSGKVRIKEIDATNMPGAYELQVETAVVDGSDASRYLHGCVFVSGGGSKPAHFVIPLPYLALDDFKSTATGKKLFTTGLDVTAAAGNNHAVNLLGSGTGAGLNTQGGLSGDGLTTTGGVTTGRGMSIIGGGIGTGLGIFGPPGQSGEGVLISSSGNGTGVIIEGTGTNGTGLSITGGDVSGPGIHIGTNDGHGITVGCAGSGKDAIHVVGAAASGSSPAGHALNLIGGASSPTAGGTAGVGLKVIGGAGSASNNGSGEGVTVAGGGTTTVSGASGFSSTGTGSLHGLFLTGGTNGDAFHLVASGAGHQISDGAIERTTLHANSGLQTVRSNTCQSGSTSTTTKLDASASATDHFYEGCAVYITGGTGANQPPLPIIGYVGSTKVCTHPTQWFTTPDNTSTFAICKAVYGSNTIIFV